MFGGKSKTYKIAELWNQRVFVFLRAFYSSMIYVKSFPPFAVVECLCGRCYQVRDLMVASTMVWVMEPSRCLSPEI